MLSSVLVSYHALTLSRRRDVALASRVCTTRPLMLFDPSPLFVQPCSRCLLSLVRVSRYAWTLALVRDDGFLSCSLSRIVCLVAISQFCIPTSFVYHAQPLIPLPNLHRVTPASTQMDALSFIPHARSPSQHLPPIA